VLYGFQIVGQFRQPLARISHLLGGFGAQFEQSVDDGVVFHPGSLNAGPG